jgi:hypothetical protein
MADFGGAYTTGTISVSAGSTTITGSGTFWTPIAEQGDLINAGGVSVYVDSVTDNTHIVPMTPWPGSDLSSSDYVLLKTSWLRYEPAITQQKVRQLLTFLSGVGYFYFVSGDVPDPSLGDEGQYALKTNVSPWKLWLRTGGSWVLQANPAEKGDAGDAGPQGPTGASFATTSTTSLAIGTGSMAFTTQAGLAYTVGARVRAVSTANTTNWMEGPVSAYSGTTLTIAVDKVNGSGTIASWNINLTGEPGAGDLSSANNLSDVANAATARANLGIPGRNAIINGDFRINQRGYASAAALAAGAYGHDRWKAGSGGGDYSFTQLASSTQITIAANKTLIQIIEDKNVVGGSYVLSWTGTAQARVGVNSATPSGSYAASPIVITGQTAGTVMSVEFGNGASTGTLGTVQIEVGTVASAFEQRPVQYEMFLCKRYFERMLPTQASDGSYNHRSYGMGWWVTSSLLSCQIYYQPKRASPTNTPSSISHFNARSATTGSNIALSTFSSQEMIAGSAYINVTIGSSVTAGDGAQIESNSPDAYIDIDAEL